MFGLMTLLFLALVLSLLLRRSRHAMWLWIPACALSLTTVVFAFARMPGPMPPGPGGGGEGIAVLIFSGVILLGLAAAAILVVFRPAGSGWSLRAAAASTLCWMTVSVALVVVWYFTTSVMVRMAITGPDGNPLPGAEVTYRGFTGGDPLDLMRFSFNGSTTADASGTASFRTHGFKSLHCTVRHKKHRVVQHVAIGRSERGFFIGFTDEIADGRRNAFGPQNRLKLERPPGNVLEFPVTIDAVELVQARMAPARR